MYQRMYESLRIYDVSMRLCVRILFKVFFHLQCIPFGLLIARAAQVYHPSFLLLPATKRWQRQQVHQPTTCALQFLSC